jgi:hypothetical protein
MNKIHTEVIKMSYVSSKKYGSAVQHYVKSNGDISYYCKYALTWTDARMRTWTRKY